MSVGYVGTRTDGQYALLNLNYAESGGNTQRKLFAQANTAAINLFASSAKTRYHSMQVAVNRPYKNGLLLKGAYTLSKAMNDKATATMAADTRGRSRRSSIAITRWQITTARTCCRLGFVYELPFARNGTGVVAAIIKDWQVNGIASWLSGLPFSIGGDNGLLQQQGGMQTINVTGDPQPGFGEAGPNEQWYDPTAFSQPGNAWGNSGRNAFRGPRQLQPGLLDLPDDPLRPLSAGDPRRIAEHPQPSAVREPGDRLHRRELHAHPLVLRRARTAQDAARRAIRVLRFRGPEQPVAAPALSPGRQTPGTHLEGVGSTFRPPDPISLREELPFFPYSLSISPALRPVSIQLSHTLFHFSRAPGAALPRPVADK